MTSSYYLKPEQKQYFYQKAINIKFFKKILKSILRNFNTSKKRTKSNTTIPKPDNRKSFINQNN